MWLDVTLSIQKTLSIFRDVFFKLSYVRVHKKLFIRQRQYSKLVFGSSGQWAVIVDYADWLIGRVNVKMAVRLTLSCEFVKECF